MPAEGVSMKKHEDILSFNEIVEVVKYGVSEGINKIRITGGEPLVRKNLPELIQQISELKGITDIGMTTNGVLLPEFAQSLKQAGLNRVNISLDTLNPDKFEKITRGGKLGDVLKGIDAAIAAGLHPVKINFVRIPGENQEDEAEVKKYCKEKGLDLRFIRQVNLKTGEFYPVKGGSGGICSICNRLRLTADGHLVPCLHSSHRYNIRKLGVAGAFTAAIDNKPETGKGTQSHEFSNIGG
jgi:cyclic pyranopterin phosphate synthase